MLEILENLSEAVVKGDSKSGAILSRKALKEKIDAKSIIQNGLFEGLLKVGELWASQEYFMPEVWDAVRVINASMEVVKSSLKVGKANSNRRIVIGVVEGDIHDLGKNLLRNLLELAGYSVYDLGRDVRISQFAEKANEVDADVVALSGTMSMSLLNMGEIIKDLRAKTKARIIVGGLALLGEKATEIGADYYGRDVWEALSFLNRR